MTFVMTNKKPATVKAEFYNAAGDPAHVQGDVSWASSDETIATVVANRPDTSEATVTPVGPSGSFTIEAAADADVGEGVRRLSVQLPSQVVGGGAAVSGSITPVRDRDPNKPVDPGFGRPGGGGPVDPGFGVGGGGHPDQGLPPSSGRPDQGLPPSPGHPDQGLPPSGGRPDQGLPPSPGHPDQGLPPSSGRPDQGLPPSGGRPDNSLPPSGNKPDNTLPPGAKPKR